MNVDPGCGRKRKRMKRKQIIIITIIIVHFRRCCCFFFFPSFFLVCIFFFFIINFFFSSSLYFSSSFFFFLLLLFFLHLFRLFLHFCLFIIHSDIQIVFLFFGLLVNLIKIKIFFESVFPFYTQNFNISLLFYLHITNLSSIYHIKGLQ